MELLNIALDACPEWKPLGHVLGFQLSEMEDIEKSRGSRGESCFSMLKRWFDAKKKPPSFEDIGNVLSHVEVGRDDLAYKYCTGKGIQYLRGCLCKNHPLNFFNKIFFSETLVIERSYWDYSRNSFGLVQKNFLVALGTVKKMPSLGQSGGVKN